MQIITRSEYKNLLGKAKVYKKIVFDGGFRYVYYKECDIWKY